MLMDSNIFPCNSRCRSAHVPSLPHHLFSRSPERRSYEKVKIFSQSLSGSNVFLSIERKTTYFDVRCSLEQDLKPRPVRKPLPIFDGSDIEPSFRESKNNQTDQSLPSALCHRIERLVFFKKYKEAIDLFEILGLAVGGSGSPEAISATTYDSLITSCVGLKSARAALSVFRHMKEHQFLFDQYMMNRILQMHLKCGMVARARRLFDLMPERNLVSWNTFISGLVDAASYDEAMEIFLVMWEALSSVTSRTIAIIVRAATGLASVSIGGQLHALGIKFRVHDNLFVSCALIDMYSKCGSIDQARQVFDQMSEKNVVGWNSIIAGYALNGYSEEALDLYYEMQESNVKLDHFTYSIITRICARLGSLEQGKQAHAGLIRNGFGKDMVACTALVDLYCKWGRMDDARNLFDMMPHKNLISWNALMGGYANHGMGAQAVAMFGRMVKDGMAPNHVTFLAILSACSYSAMLSKGRKIFESMVKDPKSTPRAMHYACMVDLLGREGNLDEALSLIKNAPFPPTANMWAAFLRACRIHKNHVLGKLAAEELYGMEPNKLGNYIVLLNIYNTTGRLNEAALVLETLKRKGLRLVLACSWIEIKKQPHRFIYGDKSHTQSEQIHKRLETLMQEIAKEGYLPQRRCVFPDVLEHDQRITGYHSELLAIAFGLISTPNFYPLQVLQGHRVCDDCHNAIKLVSLVTRREIVMRDASCFHHFRQGSCSCRDYW
ncbi:hypothetical protein HPP92_011129 [Vanilla planifolia]|uniref:DYW domain-containing protein n=1 Tax=Vanilla planifolia TaxID=51239 RepID=A0A835QZY8_VANPL|nr:hypothetical protein HPP92_011129 [Vanilla planifolia]